jgi:hypothetical protein
MHLKSYQIDGRLLRTGAANFSASGLKRQVNDLIVIDQHSPDSCRVVRNLPSFRVLGNPAPLARAVDGDGTSRRHAER